MTTTHSTQLGKGKTAQGIKSSNPLSPGAHDDDDDEDYYEEEEDGVTPGPGSYFNPQTSTTFKVKSVPERLQFFGSTVERFNRQAKKTESLPGPGAYTVGSATTFNNNRSQSATNHGLQAPFLSTNVRFMDDNNS